MLDKWKELILQIGYLIRLFKACFKVFPLFQVHLFSLYFGVCLPTFNFDLFVFMIYWTEAY